MPPPNLTAATAIDIGSLPYSVTVDPESAANTLWYKYTQETNEVLGVLACNSTVRVVGVELYLGNNPASLALQTDQFDKQAFQWPVAAGTDVYFAIYQTTYVAGDTITLSIRPGPTSTIRTGDLLILTDDTFTNLYDTSYKGFFPATWFDPDDGTVRHSSADWPSSELGVSLSDGRFAIAAKTVGTQARSLILYNSSQVEVARAAFSETIRSLGTDLSGTYYVLTSAVFANAGTLYAVDTTGAISGTTYGPLAVGNVGTVGAGGGNASMGLKRDGSILYYPHSIVGGLVRRWDMVGNAALSSFSSPNSNLIPGDVIVLSDNTIAAAFWRVATDDDLVVHYAADGSILHTLTLTRGAGVELHHIVHDAEDDAGYVWVWTELDEAETNDGSLRGTSRLRRFQWSAGVSAPTHDWTVHFFSDTSLATGVGPYDPAGTCAPERFGAPASCPLMIMMGAVSDSDLSDNQIDCPHGSYSRTIQLDGSYRRSSVASDGSYARTITSADGSYHRTNQGNDGSYVRTISDLSGSF